MSKIKTNNIQARADDGTLNIGHHYTDEDPNSPTFGQELDDYDHTTRIWGTVNIPDYASKEWVIEEVINGLEGGVDFRTFVKRDEANEVDGYPKLDGDANVSWPQMTKTINDSHMQVNATGNGMYSHKQIDNKLDQLREDLDDLEQKATQAIVYEVGAINTVPLKGQFSPDVEAYADITSIVAHKTDKEDSDHDFGHVNIGDSLEITEDEDHYGRYTVDAINIADPYCTFQVTAVSSRGDAQPGDTAYIDVLPSVDTRDLYKIDGSRRLKGENATIRWDASERPDSDLTSKSAIDATGMKVQATRFDVPHGGGFYTQNSLRMKYNSSNTILSYSGSTKMTISNGVQTSGTYFQVYGRKSSSNYVTTSGSLGNLIDVTTQPSNQAGYARYYGSISNNNDIATKKYVDDNKVSNYVTSNSNQTNLSGSKAWTGAHTFSSTAAVIKNGSTNTKGCFYQYQGNLYYNPH